jgi:hypothetical protein
MGSLKINPSKDFLTLDFELALLSLTPMVLEEEGLGIRVTAIKLR